MLRGVRSGFRHEALFYRGLDEFTATVGQFVRDGVANHEPVLVVVSAEKIGLLQSALGADASGVLFADMDSVGLNPSRIIPRWGAFVDEHHCNGRRLRGVGEPAWPGRTADEMAECEQHESLLNTAFEPNDGDLDWWLLCPYDVEHLDGDVVAGAHTTHPFVWQHRTHSVSPHYTEVTDVSVPFARPLPPPPATAQQLNFTGESMGLVRLMVSTEARSVGLSDDRIVDLVLAVSELAANSVRHGGAQGVLRTWTEAGKVVCEVSDSGHLDVPLAGRVKPSMAASGGRGLWLVNQLCDLVQIRSYPTGTVVRVHMLRARW